MILSLKLMHRRFGRAQKQAYPLTRDILDMYWFSVNWKFPMSELTYSAKGDFDEKEALQLSA